MNEVLKAIKERRSIRKFKPDMPPKEDIEKIIEAGLYAASGHGKQSNIIVAITNKEVRDRLASLNSEILTGDPNKDTFYGGPVVLVSLADKSFPTCVYDSTLVLGNMMLAAHSLGLGSIWIHRAKEEFEQEEWKQLLKDLGADGDYEGVGNLVVGYIDGEVPKAAPRKEGRVFWVE